MHLLQIDLVVTYVVLFVRGDASSTSKCTDVQFPNLHEGTVTVQEHSLLDIAFSVSHRCLTVHISTLNIKVEKSNHGVPKSVCDFTFSLKDGCHLGPEIACTCPKDGSGLYRLITHVSRNDSGKWTWTAITGGLIENAHLDIMVRYVDSTLSTFTTVMQTASTKRPSTKYTKPTTLDEITSETSPGGSNSGAMLSDVMIAIISCGIFVFAILALVIVIKRKRSSPPIYQNNPAYPPAYLHGPLPDQPVAPHAQGIPLQQLQQAHNRRSDESTCSHAYEEVNESSTCARTGAFNDTLNDQAHPNIACHPHPGHSEANSSQPEHHSGDQDASAQHGCRAKDQAQPPPVTACSDLQAENKATNSPQAYEDEGYVPPDPAFAAGNAMHTLYENTAL